MHIHSGNDYLAMILFLQNVGLVKLNLHLFVHSALEFQLPLCKTVRLIGECVHRHYHPPQLTNRAVLLHLSD